MLRYLVLLALAAYASALDDVECCSLEDRHEMSAIWQKVWSAEFVGRRVQVAKAIFHDLLEHIPEATSLFTRVHVEDFDSPEFTAHCVRVVSGLDNLISLLEDPDTLKVQLHHLAEQHKARDGVTKAHFDAIGHSFERVMPQVASCFNAAAWGRCFRGIATRMSELLP